MRTRARDENRKIVHRKDAMGPVEKTTSIQRRGESPKTRNYSAGARKDRLHKAKAACRNRYQTLLVFLLGLAAAAAAISAAEGCGGVSSGALRWSPS